ncbi:MAG: aldo/keto reductase [bacterium]|nr:aldo/keto reductase [bacterium]
MNTVRLGRTNVEVSAVGLGSWAYGGPKIVNGRPVGWFGSEDGRARESLRRAGAAGITHWDTADVYGEGHAERLIGESWDEVPRDRVLLASKVGWVPGPHPHYYHPEQMRRQLESSLRNLRTEYIDLYYLHHCDFGTNDEYLDAAVEQVRAFRDEGKVRFLGLSDWKTENIVRYLDRVDPDVIQCYRNVVDDSFAASGLKDWVEQHDTGVVFCSPLKHALLLGRFEGPVTFGEGDHRNSLQDFRDFGLLTRLRRCRRELQQRFPQHPGPVLYALLGALLSDSPTGCTVIGLHRPEHVDAAATAGQPLSEEHARWVRKLYLENGRPTRASWRSFHQAT